MSLLVSAVEQRRGKEIGLSAISINKQNGSRARAWHSRLQDVFVESPEDLLSLGLVSLRACLGQCMACSFPSGLYDPDSFRADRLTSATTDKKTTNF